TTKTIRHPLRSPSQESEVVTHHASIDRTGVAARFLRLAYRINMDQLKLVEKEPLAPLEPLLTGDVEDETESSSLAPSESSSGQDHDDSQPTGQSEEQAALATQPAAS